MVEAVYDYFLAIPRIRFLLADDPGAGKTRMVGPGCYHILGALFLINEYKTANRLKKDYWLYVVFNCSSTPELYIIQDPARLEWKPLVKVEHYHIGVNEILEAEQ